MSPRPLRRLGVAAVLAVGALLATAAPASASATHVEIGASSTLAVHVPTGGTVPSTNLMGFHENGHPTTNVCAPNSSPPAHIPVNLDSSGGGTIGAHPTAWRDWAFGGSTYKVRVNILSATLAFSASGVTVNLTFDLEIRACASTTVLCRTNGVPMTLTGANPTGTHHPTASTTFVVTGVSAPITVPTTCNIILRFLLLNTMVIAAFNLHFTDSTA